VVIYGGAGNSGYNAGSVFLNGGSATASGGVSGNVILANVRGFVVALYDETVIEA
jgi:hypothetical protein